MDMKRILQAMDGAATAQPVEGVNDMKKFVSIINEGTRSPSVAEQMVTTQYATPQPKPLVEKTVPKQASPLRGYYNLVESEQSAVAQEKQAQISERARLIAERVLMKERTITEKSKSEKQARFMAAAAHDPEFAKRVGMDTSVAKEFNKKDTGTKLLSKAMKHKKNVEENEVPGHSMGFTGGVGPGIQSNEPTEGYQDFNKVEPYYVCLAGKPVKRFEYYEHARRFHDNWKQKLYREGNKEKADKITLMPIFDEATNRHFGPKGAGTELARQIRANGDLDRTKQPEPSGVYKKNEFDITEPRAKIQVKKNKGVAEGDDHGDLDAVVFTRIDREKKRLADLKKNNPEAYAREIAREKSRNRIPPVSTFEEQDVAEAEGDAEGLPHLTPELAQHILQQMKDEGPHAIIKSMEWGDGAAHDIIELFAHALRSVASNQEVAEDCWKNYEQKGMKKKGSKTVPNCVPKK